MNKYYDFTHEGYKAQRNEKIILNLRLFSYLLTEVSLSFYLY
jgi:hypothetical protein